MTLREYQSAAVKATWTWMRENKGNPCIVMPTGTGKSLVLARLASDAVRWGGRVIILVHVKELLEQNADKLRKLAPDLDVGIYSAGLNKRQTANSVVVAGIQSVYKRAAELGGFDVAIVDEAHLIPPDGEGMYRTFLQAAETVSPHLRVVGLTATPYRLKGGEICAEDNLLNEICYEAGLKEMTLQGWLAPLKSRCGTARAKLDGLHVRGGEFIASEVEEAMGEAAVTSKACAEIVELTKDCKSVLVFAASVKHCNRVAQLLADRTGAETAVITGDTPANVREETLARFRGEKISADLFGEVKPQVKYLVNVNVLTTGFDAPNVDCVVMLRPTASPGLYVQMAGRGTRKAEGKTACMLLDYGGNVVRHGCVDAVNPGWRSAGNGGGEAPAKECMKCHALVHAGYKLCPECGAAFPPPKTSIDGSAHGGGVMSGETVEERLVVKLAEYRVWTKKGADALTPKTMRVEYQVGFNRWASEWVCPEHLGFARKKFERWWTARSHAPCPDTAARAVTMAIEGALATPKDITVRTVSGDRFSSVVAATLPDKPEYFVEAGVDMAEAMEYVPAIDDEEEDKNDNIPF